MLFTVMSDCLRVRLVQALELRDGYALKGPPVLRQTMTPCLLVLFAAVLFVAGCDQEAAEQEQAQASLDQAIKALDRMTVKFIPPDQPQDQPWSQYRLTLLSEAESELDTVLQDADGVQAAVAEALKGQVLLSEARLRMNAALGAYPALSARTTVMVDRLATVNLSGMQLTRLKPASDEAVQTLKSKISELNSQVSKLESRQRELAGQIQDRQSQIAKLQKQIQAQVKQADQFHQQAFVASGAEQLDLEDQQAAAEAEAASLQSQVDLMEVEIEQLQHEHMMAQRRGELARESLGMLQNAVDQATQRQRAREGQRQTTSQDLQQVADQLMQNVGELLDDFNEQVDQPLDEAAAKLAESTQHFTNARQQTDNRRMRNTLELSELAARVDQTQAMTNHVIVLSDLGNFVQFVQNTTLPLTSSQKSQLRQAYQELKQRQQDVFNALSNGDDAAFNQATQLTESIGGDEQQSRLSMLETYQRMANSALLK